MEINIQKFNEVAEAAKARTSDKLWRNAIDKAVAGVTSGWWIITELHDGVMVTTECGHTYHANGSCQCKAYELGQPCKHRALARLLDIYESEVAAPATFAADVEASTRKQLIAEIENIWPRFAPGVPLYTELLACFGKSHLDMLDVGLLRDIRLAVAM